MNRTTFQQISMERESPSNSAPIRHATTGHWDGRTIRSASGCTLFDIIQQDDNWKPVKDRLRLQQVGSAFSEDATVDDGAPPSVIVENISSMEGGGSRMLPSGASSLKRNLTLARTISRSVSVRPTSSAQPMGEIVITEITDITDEVPDEPEEEEPTKGRVSLLSLLEQTDKTTEIVKDDDHDEDDDDDEEEETEGEYYVCCVCMVRHKGAAFIPCGHTFCRLCSRELWVSTGNCPLCNGFVQEILDIF